MDFQVLTTQAHITNPNITVVGFAKHTKASELYAEVIFSFPDEPSEWRGYIPYWYRRTGVFIETEEELAGYLMGIYPNFSQAQLNEFVNTGKKFSEVELVTKEVTKPFFDILLNMRWNSVKYDFPANPNWARRIQDIKELGFTLATATKRKVDGKEENDTHLMLIPIPKGAQTGYETFTPAFKNRALKLLNYRNAYDLSSGNKSGLLPDHKFPEIRWDENTREENSEDMSDDEVRAKFQLLDNQRNQQKREICRTCFQTGKRGIIFGINYFHVGDENWPADVPRVGKDAENGCKGCGWYDIDAWRIAMNNGLKK